MQFRIGFRAPHRRPLLTHHRLAAAVAISTLVVARTDIRAVSAGETNAVAIIVNGRNDAPDPSLSELQSMLTLDRQFWSTGNRLVLFLPPANSAEKHVLLSSVYKMSDTDLRRYWVAKLFRGAIPAIPSSMRTTAAVANAVQQSQGAISAIPADEVPPGVRVFKIDGKLPGEDGYPLVAASSP